MSLVIDASVACKWFIEEEGSVQAEALLAGGGGLLAPDLIVPEVCNTFWRKARVGQMTWGQAAVAVGTLTGFFDDLIPAARLAAKSFAIAQELDHPVYDCFYLALAEAEDTRVVTADARLLARLAGTAWARHGVSLYDGVP